MRQLPLLLACLLLQACASLIDGPNEDIPVTTNPPGATVTEENTSQITPAKLTLERKRDYLLTITKEGYKTKTIKIEHVVNSLEAGNLLGCTLLGTAIDTATGAAWTLKPDNIYVTLEPLSAQEKVNEENRVTEKNLQNQLKSLQELKESNLLTDDQYRILKHLTMHCVQNST